MIRKRIINDTVIVLIGNNIITRTGVSAQEWNEIGKLIDEIHQEFAVQFENSNTVTNTGFYETICESEKYEELLDMLTPPSAEMIHEEEEFQKASDKVQLELDFETRMDYAKRISDISGIFEYDSEGLTYLKGFKHPMNKTLIEALLDAHYNPSSEYSVDSLVNFWKFLLLNPDKHVRDGLFAWIATSNFSITETGEIIAYRNVDVMTAGLDKKLEDFISQSWIKIKRWKKSPKNYVIQEAVSAGVYTLGTFDKISKNLKIIGNLHDLYTSNDKSGDTVYTDQHSRSMKIIIGEPVTMDRDECDNDPNASCSRGLHNKSSKYSLNLGSDLLVTLVNPYNVVAIPSYDTTKFRCCEYLPVAKAEIDEDDKLVEFSPGTYDIEYNGLSNLAKLLDVSSMKELQDKGLISTELDEGDFDFIMSEARDTISKRVVKVNE